MFYTLGQASKATGTSKSTLSKAIKSGKLSAQRQQNGSFLIDPSELFRVYKPVAETGEGNSSVKHHETPSNPGVLQGKLEDLREERERERQQMQEIIDDLRRRLDEEATERREASAEIRRLTLMLTDRSETTQAEPERDNGQGGRLWRAWWR